MHLFLCFLNQALVDFVAINNAFIINSCKIKPSGWVDGKSDVMNGSITKNRCDGGMYGTEVASASAYISMGLWGDDGAGTDNATGPANRIVIPAINPTLIIITIWRKAGLFDVEIFFPDKKSAGGAIFNV